MYEDSVDIRLVSPRSYFFPCVCGFIYCLLGFVASLTHAAAFRLSARAFNVFGGRGLGLARFVLFCCEFRFACDSALVSLGDPCVMASHFVIQDADDADAPQDAFDSDVVDVNGFFDLFGDTREAREMVGWQAFVAPASQRIWWHHEGTGEWFYEDACPENGWTGFTDPNSRVWFWHDATSRYFFA